MPKSGSRGKIIAIDSPLWLTQSPARYHAKQHTPAAKAALRAIRRFGSDPLIYPIAYELTSWETRFFRIIRGKSPRASSRPLSLPQWGASHSSQPVIAPLGQVQRSRVAITIVQDLLTQFAPASTCVTSLRAKT